MVKFINNLTGCEMWVDESRKEEYIQLGHKLAPSVSPVKKTTRKKPVKKED